MKTIKSKLFFIFILLMAAFVFCSLLLNALFLEKYYIYTSRDQFIASKARIAEVYKTQFREIPAVLKAIDRVDGISSSIFDRNMKQKFSSYPAKPGGGQSEGKLPRELEDLVREQQNDDEHSYVYGIVESPDYHVREIAFISRLEDGGILVMKKQLKGITESSAIANRFSAFVSLFIMLVGGIVVYLFSRRMTRPIVIMSRVAEGISNLDFSRQIPVDSDDEIGDLGRSINLISEKLSASIGSLRQDVERRKQLVRNLSHEMKTPIGVIKGYAEGLKFGIADDPQKTSAYCTVIAEECDRMDGMVRELLNLSMLESETFETHMVPLDAGELVRRVAEKFAPIMTDRNISLDVQCESGMITKADPELIERVISNYLQNALNHVDQKRHIKIEARKIGHGIRISVFNSGTNIPELEMSNIWDVFYTIDRARTRKVKGHGLGLSIVKSIMEIHEGAWGVINEPDGVCFYIELWH